MTVLFKALVLVLAAHRVFATPLRARSSFVVKETHTVPSTWTEVGRPNPAHRIDLNIGLKQGNFAKLEKHFWDISNPDHPNYGQHLAKAEVDNLVKPNNDTKKLVREWLQDNGIAPETCRISPSGDWITTSLSVNEIEELLNTNYSTYQHTEGDTLVRTTSWSLPAHLHDHIRTIQPTTAFLRVSPQMSHVLKVPGTPQTYKSLPVDASGISKYCDFSAVTPTCLRNLYGTIDYTPTGYGTIGFNNFLGQVPDRADTEEFLQLHRPEAIASAWRTTQISITGGVVDNGTSPAGVEGNLDFQTIAGMIWPLNITSYSTGGSPPFIPDSHRRTNSNEPYLTWLTWALEQSSLPSVISTSYGDDEQTVPYSYAVSVCNDMVQLGARGISLLFSSGDSGVGPNNSCISNDGRSAFMFLPQFPASCPYVTTVGGTRGFPEVVANNSENGYVSGSGFSNYFPRPSYQDSVVESFLVGLPHYAPEYYNASGRAYPDIAAQGYHFLTIFNNHSEPVDGTSCSAPTAASIIALLNDMLLANGRPVLGFLNPWLYQIGHKGFNDVVNGSSSGCGMNGFAARPGWDVASGFGTPNFDALGDVLFPQWKAN